MYIIESNVAKTANEAISSCNANFRSRNFKFLVVPDFVRTSLVDLGFFAIRAAPSLVSCRRLLIVHVY